MLVRPEMLCKGRGNEYPTRHIHVLELRRLYKKISTFIYLYRSSVYDHDRYHTSPIFSVTKCCARAVSTKVLPGRSMI